MTEIQLLKTLLATTQHHMKNCEQYRWYVESAFPNWASSAGFEQLPWLPTRAFKEFKLKSIADHEIFKVMLSSGTNGIQSRIYLDTENAKSQQKMLFETFVQNFGNRRYPMLVVDSVLTVKDRSQFSARTAAINGFSFFSRGRQFALNEHMQLDLYTVQKFLEENFGKKIFLFGFTFIVWQFFLQQIRERNLRLDLSNCFLLHGGGWKKLESEKISVEQFKRDIFELTGCHEVRNYYGTIEQTGTIYIECSKGCLHAAPGAHAITRSMTDLKSLKNGQVGLIQLFSSIQKSYPGHSILTEDIGLTHPAKSCACGSSGTVLQILERAKRAEVRGCSDAVNR